jgi:DHA1 family bicyclomycin/chloramphenicol resistance-like MFS transporter
MLNHPEAAGAGSALLGGAQYAVGGLAGPLVTLAGDSATAMSIGMGIAAASAFTVWNVLRSRTDQPRNPGPMPSDSTPVGRP